MDCFQINISSVGVLSIIVVQLVMSRILEKNIYIISNESVTICILRNLTRQMDLTVADILL